MQLDYGYTSMGLVTLKPWASRGILAVYERSSLSFMNGAYLKQTSPMYILPCFCCLASRLPSHAAIRLIAYRFISCRACYKRIQLELSTFLVSFMSTLQSGSSPSLSFSQLSWSTLRCGQSWRNIWMHSFEIYGKWLVQASKQEASKLTHTHAQCGHTSVGLAWGSPQLVSSLDPTISRGEVVWWTSQISWAYYPKVVRTNEIERSIIIM